MSCKGFLDVDPYGKADADLYYSTEEEVGLALIAAYDMVHSDQLNGWSSAVFIKQLPSDGTNCGGGGASDQPQYQDLDDFNWSTENAGIKAYYQVNFYGIYRCNQIINKTTVEGSALVDRMIAEAKFLRAYFFFELNVAFGGVPLRLQAPETVTEGMARSTPDEVYAQIEADLADAIAGLPNKSEYSQADKFRASKQSAQALLGKAHLYQKDYSAAINVFEDIIAVEGTEVDLEADFAELFKASTEFGIESLFEASFVSEGKNWGNANWDRVADDNRHIQLQGPRGPFDGGTSGILAGWGFNAPTQKLYDAFEDTDPRRLMTIISTQELEDIYGGSFIDGHDTESMIRTKLTTYASETNGDNGNTPELNFGTNWKLIRYADVLLMAAEAYHFNGADGTALDLVNQVRMRSGASELTGITGDALFDLIVNERQVELAYEGHRFWDLVRWGLADDELSSLGFISGKHELFPIPLDEILNNPEMDASSQNPGY